MIPQASEILPIEYFQSLTARINAVSSCVELQELTADALASIQATQNAINEQLALITPILALLTAPSANPAAIVSWLTSFITNFLTPYVRPNITYASQLAQLSTQIAGLTSAINTKSLEFPSCNISLPP